MSNRRGREGAALVAVTVVAVWALQGLPALFLLRVVYPAGQSGMGSVLAFWTGPEWVGALPVFAAALWCCLERGFPFPRAARPNLMVSAVRATIAYAVFAMAAGYLFVLFRVVEGSDVTSLALLAGPANVAWTGTVGALFVGILVPTILLHPRGDAALAPEPVDRDAAEEDAIVEAIAARKPDGDGRP
ncbi:hypothetical protein [Microbacterium sp. TNHR37B]|uniref:hypothetical protein n=1 Tax=Microbacterium sp. TNHR37B TaxID=1775956 RepID=UPI0007B24E2F|nr:hypothetical protein [Microbacterium sp. TNHR37B]KZE89079.1 hypothetical protein AVP41_01870 [Microbacterium sp. TNHR37B]